MTEYKLEKSIYDKLNLIEIMHFNDNFFYSASHGSM